MKNWSARLAVALLVSLAGCASSPPQPELKAVPGDKMAIVNFVRLGYAASAVDTADVEVWDGPHFIGALPPGGLIQYEVEAGSHVFMGHSGNWSYATGDLQAGKQYVLKANIAPGFATNKVFLGVAKADDLRISIWLGELKRLPPAARQGAAGDSPKRAEAVEAMSALEAGRVRDVPQIGPENALDRLPEPKAR